MDIEMSSTAYSEAEDLVSVPGTLFSDESSFYGLFDHART